jgi:hypothetical protein
MRACSSGSDICSRSVPPPIHSGTKDGQRGVTGAFVMMARRHATVNRDLSDERRVLLRFALPARAKHQSSGAPAGQIFGAAFTKWINRPGGTAVREDGCPGIVHSARLADARKRRGSFASG